MPPPLAWAPAPNSVHTVQTDCLHQLLDHGWRVVCRSSLKNCTIHLTVGSGSYAAVHSWRQAVQLHLRPLRVVSASDQPAHGSIGCRHLEHLAAARSGQRMSPPAGALPYGSLFRYSTLHERGVIVMGCLAAAVTGPLSATPLSAAATQPGLLRTLTLFA